MGFYSKTMLWIYSFVIFELSLYCSQPLIAESGNVVNATHINVTGYLNYYKGVDLRVVMVNVTWYTAVRACQSLNYGKFDTANLDHMRTSMATALLKLHGYKKTTIWTNWFRPDNTSNLWVDTYTGLSCNAGTGELLFNVSNADERCAANVYDVIGSPPSFQTRNCSSPAGFQCYEKQSDPLSFIEYHGYDVDQNPPQNTSLKTYYFNLIECVTLCRYRSYCVGFTYNSTDEECRIYMNDVYGFAYLNYTLTVAGSNVSHFTKAGQEAMLVNRVNISSLVNDSFECSGEPSLSTTTELDTTTELNTTTELDTTTSPTSTLMPPVQNASTTAPSTSDLTSTFTTSESTNISTTLESTNISTTPEPTNISTISESIYSSTISEPTTSNLTTSEPTTTTLDPTTTSTTLDQSTQYTTLDPKYASTTSDPFPPNMSLDPTFKATTLDPSTQYTTFDPKYGSITDATTTSTTHVPTTTSTTPVLTTTSTTPLPTTTSTTPVPTTTSTTPLPTTTSTTPVPTTTSTTPVPTTTSTTPVPTTTSTNPVPRNASTTPVPTTTSTTHVPTTTSTMCTCNDFCPAPLTESEVEETGDIEAAKIIEEAVHAIVKNLTIDPKETNKFKQSKISIADDRPSSIAIGTISVVIISLIFGSIALSDISLIIRFIQQT